MPQINLPERATWFQWRLRGGGRRSLLRGCLRANVSGQRGNVTKKTRVNFILLYSVQMIIAPSSSLHKVLAFKLLCWEKYTGIVALLGRTDCFAFVRAIVFSGCAFHYVSAPGRLSIGSCCVQLKQSKLGKKRGQLKSASFSGVMECFHPHENRFGVYHSRRATPRLRRCLALSIEITFPGST